MVYMRHGKSAPIFAAEAHVAEFESRGFVVCAAPTPAPSNLSPAAAAAVTNGRRMKRGAGESCVCSDSHFDQMIADGWMEVHDHEEHAAVAPVSGESSHELSGDVPNRRKEHVGKHATGQSAKDGVAGDVRPVTADEPAEAADQRRVGHPTGLTPLSDTKKPSITRV